VENITTVVGEIADPRFPVKSLDLITMLYAFHDFTEKAAWLGNAKKHLKKGGAIFIFDGQDDHTGLSRGAVEQLAEEAGLRLVRHEHLHGGIWAFELRPTGES
jgi:ubiquinone/menaquinone biosynthesis C-methylase UbiE